MSGALQVAEIRTGDACRHCVICSAMFGGACHDFEVDFSAEAHCANVASADGGALQGRLVAFATLGCAWARLGLSTQRLEGSVVAVCILMAQY